MIDHGPGGDLLSFELRAVMWKEIWCAIFLSKKLDIQSGGKGLLRNNNDSQNCATNYLDASRAAFTHSVGHSSTWRINHGDEAQKAELLRGEVCLVAVEGESSRKLGWRQIQVAESWRRRGIKEMSAHHGRNLPQLSKKKFCPIKETIFQASFTPISSKKVTKRLSVLTLISQLGS